MMSASSGKKRSTEKNTTVSSSAAASAIGLMNDVDDEEMIEEEEVHLGSGEFEIVGIRYYNGTAHPGEMVLLEREPSNPYDRNAIRVDNMHHQKIGHIKREIANVLSPLLDTKIIRLEGTIPRRGNAYTLPLALDFMGSAGTQLPTGVAVATGQDDFLEVARSLQSRLGRYQFHVAPEYAAQDGEDLQPSNKKNRSKPKPPPVIVQSTKIDWGKQQEELDTMFDKQLEEQLKNLPDLIMPTEKGDAGTALMKNITLFEYQIQGIQWLVEKETNPRPAPFYKEVQEKGKRMYLCEITQSSQRSLPKTIRGSILCDDMGLGKSIQTLGLLLLAPPSGKQYTKPIVAAAAATSDNTDDQDSKLPPCPTESIIRSANIATLKSILKQSNLKVSGKKNYLVERILDGISNRSVKSTYFPPSMMIMPSSSGCGGNNHGGFCTLIVCPLSVMSNWTQQIQDHIEEGVLNLQLYHGSNRHDLLGPLKNGTIDVMLVSYHTLSADYTATFGKEKDGTSLPLVTPLQKKTKRETIFDIPFHRLVLDEAHTIRNHKSKFFKAVQQIQSDRKLALTGTPFVNRADDVQSLLAFLQMEPLGNKSVFTRAIAKPIKQGEDIGLARLRTAMGCVSLRRSKQNISIKMVDKHVQLATVEFNENSKHKQLYDALFGIVRVAVKAIFSSVSDTGNDTTPLQNYSTIFEKILRLRQSCCSGILIKKDRREIALKLWNDVTSSSSSSDKIELTAEQGLELLEKLKGELLTTTTLQDEDSSSNELPTCGICFEEFDRTQVTILKTCEHCFCRSCVLQVLSKSNHKCPYCRKDFKNTDIIDMSTAQSAAAKVNQEGIDEDKKQAAASMSVQDDDFDVPPKISALLQSIQTTMKPDEKGVIFSQFTSFLDLIGDAMKAAGHSFVRVDGSVPVRKRIEYIRRFNNDDDSDTNPRFILCSLLASGTGINLTRGNHAYLMDCWWNEAIESQAMDRIHRLNQTRECKITKFVMKGSIEERIVKLQQAKSMQAKGVLQKLTGSEKRKALFGDLRGLLELDVDDNDNVEENSHSDN